MRGIILAAGRGKRLEPVLKNRPKCLLEFGAKTLLHHQVAACAMAGVKEFVVVVGYEKEQIIAHAMSLPFSFTFVENPVYAETNTLHSLWLARDYLSDDFIYCNADVLFDYRIAQKIVAHSTDSTLACTSSRCAEEEVKVVVDGDRITKIGKTLDPARCYGEFIGIARFAKAANIDFVRILDECAADVKLRNQFFEHAVDILARLHSLRCLDVSDLPATEIDFPRDLQRAQLEVFPAMHTTADGASRTSAPVRDPQRP